MSTTALDMVRSATARVATVTAQDAWEEIVRGDAVVLDVREPIEWEEHIEGAVKVPRGILEFQADPASAAHNPALDPAARVVVVCRSGTRAALAAATLMDLGFTDVVNLAGGMTAWKQDGLPTSEVHAEF
jgi:rhodanese-related sulfurtransferase